ncbi:MAG: hypothetical protein CMM87_03280 [Rickettsiales bacterium]|nr:hypothetical protein [Rickettsiales bacterium]
MKKRRVGKYNSPLRSKVPVTKTDLLKSILKRESRRQNKNANRLRTLKNRTKREVKLIFAGQTTGVEQKVDSIKRLDRRNKIVK